MKVEAAEGTDQTQRYVDVDAFQGIDLEKADVPTDSHHYLYVAPAEAAPPDAEEFVHVSWEWIGEQFQEFLAESTGAYPARTTAQIADFSDTIRTELTMTDYGENQREKVQLYLDHYEDISAVQSAFEDRWEQFIQQWGQALANALDGVEIVDDPVVPDEHVTVDLSMDNGDQRRWIFRQGNGNWAWLFPREWWTDLETGDQIYARSPPNGRVGYLHRPDWNRDAALCDLELVLYLRNAPGGAPDSFHDGFAERFNADEEIPALLPGPTTRSGRKNNVLEATYDIAPESHEDFFAAYIDALARALEDHVVANPELVEAIDRIYDETVEDVTL